MNNLMMFENKSVEVFEFNGQVLFNPYHCGNCLELAESSVRDSMRKMNTNQVIKLNNSNVGITNFRKLHNTGENFLTESGVYKLIFKSKKKEAEKFQDWVTDEVLPQIRKSGGYTNNKKKSKPDSLLKEKEIEARLKNARAREANILLKICSNPNLSKEYVQVLQSKATEIITGQAILPLPEVGRKTYSATQIGEMLGISANKVGSLAKKHNLKTEEYGKLFHDKSRYSNKEVETFRYYEEVIPILQSLI